MTASKYKRSKSPPISPVLLLEFLESPLAIAGLQPFLNLAIDSMFKTHADVFDRTVDQSEMVYLIDPIDLPFAFELTIALSQPRLVPSHNFQPYQRYHLGPVINFNCIDRRIGWWEHVAFFGELIIENDTEAVLVLRNAVDGADIDIVEGLTSITPDFSKPAKAFVHTAQCLYACISVDLSTAAVSFQALLERRIKTQLAELKHQTERPDEMT